MCAVGTQALGWELQESHFSPFPTTPVNQPEHQDLVTPGKEAVGMYPPLKDAVVKKSF